MNFIPSYFHYELLPGTLTDLGIVLGVPSALILVLVALIRGGRDSSQVWWGGVAIAFSVGLADALLSLSWSRHGLNYSVPQVVVSGLVMIGLVAVLSWRCRAAAPRESSGWWVSVMLVVWAAVVGYAVGWGLIAGLTDSSGLWVVGLVLLVGGVTAGLSFVAVLAVGVRVIRDRRRVKEG